MRSRRRTRIFDDMKTIDKYDVLRMFAESHVEDRGKLGEDEACKRLEKLAEDGELLMIDGDLL